jgi:hypothetical protein
MPLKIAQCTYRMHFTLQSLFYMLSESDPFGGVAQAALHGF